MTVTKYIRATERETLSLKQNALLDRAIRLAAVSDCKQQHGAILERSGNIISVGVNVMRNDPRPWMPYDALSNHAEYSCLSSVPRIIRGTLYVARISPGGNVRNSEPCIQCKRYIETWTQIRTVIHT